MRKHIGRQGDGRCSRCSGVNVEPFDPEETLSADTMYRCSTCGTFAGFMGDLVNLGYCKAIEKLERRCPMTSP